MKLKEYLLESTIVEIKNLVGEHLLENVVDYLSFVVGLLKNKKPEDVFIDKAADNDLDFTKDTSNVGTVDLNHLAMILTGLKVFANPDYRSGLTKDDLGINPNDAKELYDLLNKVDKTGKNPQDVNKIFIALCKLAKTGYKHERADLEKLKTGTDQERTKAIQELSQKVSKVQQIFGKLKTGSTEVPSLGDF